MDIFRAQLDAGLLVACRHFGLPVPVSDDNARGWHFALPQQAPESFSAALQAFDTPVSEASADVLWLPEAPQEWGCARLEAAYSEDLLLQPGRAERSLPRRLNGGEAADAPLQQLFDHLRLLLGDRDWLVYWGRQDETVWLLGLFPWGWTFPDTRWLELPGLQGGLSPLSQAVLQQAAVLWREKRQPDSSDSNAYHWLETLGGELRLAATEVAARGGYVAEATAFPWRTLLMARWRTRAALEEIWDSFRILPVSFTGDLRHWRELLSRFLPMWLELQQAIRALGQPLEKSGTLATFQAAHLNPTARLHSQLVPLREQAQRLMINQGDQRLSPDALLRSPHFRKSWQLMLGDFGHLAPNAFDLAVPRLGDEPDWVLDSLMRPWGPEPDGPEWNWRHWLDTPRWRSLVQLIDLSEGLYSDTLWALHQLRQRLLLRAREAVDAGLLPDADAIWWLHPDELAALDQGLVVPTAVVLERRQLLARWPLIWQQLGEAPVTVMEGEPLGNGLVVGQAWVVQRPPATLPEGFKPWKTILVAPDVDAGWTPLLAQVAGVLTWRGQRLSPSAHLVRELGRPGILGVASAARLETGQWLRLNAETGSVTLLEQEPD